MGLQNMLLDCRTRRVYVASACTAGFRCYHEAESVCRAAMPESTIAAETRGFRGPDQSDHGSSGTYVVNLSHAISRPIATKHQKSESGIELPLHLLVSPKP